VSSIYYSRRGGAFVGAAYGTWPFGKIEIADGSVTVRVWPWTRRTLGVAEVLRVESVGHFSTGSNGAGVRIYFRGKHWEEYVDFYSGSAQREVLVALVNAGFNVIHDGAK
jgi:hypothetical protein